MASLGDRLDVMRVCVCVCGGEVVMEIPRITSTSLTGRNRWVLVPFIERGNMGLGTDILESRSYELFLDMLNKRHFCSIFFLLQMEFEINSQQVENL